ncbi:MAG TPA: 16S rRNA (adenine(1518)-N(6)/adenine(1519)-N(6))-dimethyltransferase RsmA [Rickettsiales bacterium]|nr:16S rRNA (adenine(1518)-N(6)/adenine(1519)-N(6))-dimethyltransferase RsmA [Rickettsiales bacterium]
MLPTTAEFIKKYGLDAKKSLGQNFILDKNFTDKIAKSALSKGVQDFSNDIILEIGPGPASLTRSILDLNPKKLIVVEKDERCIKILQEIQEFYGTKKLEIINEDALKIDEERIFTKNQKIKIISNLPYNIGTVLLIKWLKMANKIESMVLMLQKEVVERIVAKSNSNNYGRLAIICNFLAKTEMLFMANRAIFTPPPKVTSAIVKISPYEKSLFDIPLVKLENITAAAFNQRRKMIKSSLKNFFFEHKIAEILQKTQIDGNLRPENLTIEQFCQLAKFS